jgi:pimeloyl-ACP methyl ester carboxylesterase
MLKHPDRVEKAVFEAPGPLVPGREEDFVPRPPISPVDADRWARANRPTARLAVGRQLDIGRTRAAFYLVPDWEADQWWERQFAESLLLRQAWVSCSEADGAEVVARLRLTGGSGVGFFSFNFLNEDLFRLGDVRPRLRGNTTAVLVVHPQCDILTWASALEYRKWLPNSCLVPIAGAGHMFWYGERQVHDSVIEAFLTDAPLPIEDYPKDTPPWTDRP